LDEARRIEQDVHFRRKIQIPKKIFLITRERLTEEGKTKVDKLLDKYSSLKGFYWAKEKIRELYRQESQRGQLRSRITLSSTSKQTTMASLPDGVIL